MSYSVDLTKPINIGDYDSYITVDGTVNQLSGWNLSAYVPVVSGASYHLQSGGVLGNSPASVYYDANKVLIVGHSTNTGGRERTTAPQNAKYIRVSYYAGYACNLVQTTMLDAYPSTDPVDPPPIEPEPVEPTYDGLRVSQSLLDDLNANSITLYVNDVDATVLDAKIPYGSSLKMIITVNNRVFVTSGDSDADVSYRDENGFFINFKMGATNKIAILTSFEGLSYTSFNINTKLVEPDPDPVDPTLPPVDGFRKGTNDVYRLDKSKVRDFITTNFNGNNGTEAFDFAKYILGLIEIPFTVPESEVLGIQNIQLSSYKTDFTAELLAVDELKFDLGSVTVPLTSGDSLDYKGKTCLIHVPYCEPLAINSDYVLGETVRVEFVVSLYDSLTTVNVYSTKLNDLVMSKSIDLNASIPFGIAENRPSRNRPDSVKLAVNNELDHVFIEVISNEYLLTDGLFTIPVIDECLIGDCSGYIKVENINLVSKATTKEKDLLMGVLTSGILI